MELASTLNQAIDSKFVEGSRPSLRLWITLLLAGLAIFSSFLVPNVILVLAGQLSFVVFYLLAFRVVKRSPIYSKYHEIVFAYFVFALVVFLNTVTVGLASLYGTFLIPLVDTPSVILPILLLTKASGKSLSSIYVQRGNLRLGLKIGVPAFVLTTIGIVVGLQAFLGNSYNFGYAKLLTLAPLALILSFLNAPKEELWFRGLFLKKTEPFLGRRGSNLLQAPIFMLAHFVPQYAQLGPAFLLSFLLLVFLAGIAWGYMMQRTDSIICSTLSHAGADMGIYLPILLGIL